MYEQLLPRGHPRLLCLRPLLPMGMSIMMLMVFASLPPDRLLPSSLSPFLPAFLIFLFSFSLLPPSFLLSLEDLSSCGEEYVGLVPVRGYW